jgi:hypothetical protein
MTTRLLRAAASIATLAAAAACGPFHRGPSGEATAVFQNQSTNQVDVYANGPDNVPVRIGSVLAGQTQALTIPAVVMAQGGQVNIGAHPLAQAQVQGAPASGPITMHVGDTIRIRLSGDMKTLSVIPADAKM